MSANEKRQRRNRHRGGGLLLTPLIDVIFLVALFFVLNTSFRQERYLDVSLPESETAEEQQAEGIVLSLREDGSVALEGTEIPWESLAAELTAMAAERNISEVIVRGDESVPYGRVVSLLDRIRKAGLEAITLQAVGKREGS